ncbi:DUF3997 domain-containing protein [Clostridium oceanicum]|uniref:DUF3997 domain-containing protein n=1 Tax=Clostridium oceanicum TaxID=1543 RepID=A0ABP3UMY6_9CLOT
MKQFFKIMIITLISLLFYGCAGLGDFEIKLSKGYVLSRSSANMVTINKKEDGNSLSQTIIPEKVDKVSWNDKYILVKRINVEKENTSSNKKNRDKASHEPESDYWIIKVDNGNLYPSPTYEEFLEKRKELCVPNNLKLKKVSELKPVK